MPLMEWIVNLIARFAKAIWRVVRVKRTEPALAHRLVEYVDAFLFGDGEDTSVK
jgi:hypothetical protein